MIHATITVNGTVQGVGFRYFVVRQAESYNLTGYVKNLPNGSVLCEVEGESGLINDFLKELNVGPSASRVTGLTCNKSKNLYHYTKFEVKF